MLSTVTLFNYQQQCLIIKQLKLIAFNESPKTNKKKPSKISKIFPGYWKSFWIFLNFWIYFSGTFFFFFRTSMIFYRFSGDMGQFGPASQAQARWVGTWVYVLPRLGFGCANWFGSPFLSSRYLAQVAIKVRLLHLEGFGLVWTKVNFVQQNIHGSFANVLFDPIQSPSQTLTLSLIAYLGAGISIDQGLRRR